MPSPTIHAFSAGTTTYSANAPSVSTPRIWRLRQMCARPVLHVVHLGADGFHGSRDLVAERHRHAGHAALCPLVPIEDVEIGAADRGGVHADLHLALARIRDRHVLELGARTRCGLAQGTHRA